MGCWEGVSSGGEFWGMVVVHVHVLCVVGMNAVSRSASTSQALVHTLMNTLVNTLG